MNQEQRDALRKLAEEATPGPWADDGWLHVGATYSDQVNGGYFTAECHGPNKTGNMRYIAAANPQAIIELLDYIETLERDAARWGAMSSLMFIGEVACRQDDDGGYSISVDPVENMIGKTFYGDTPDAAIDAAMGEAK